MTGQICHEVHGVTSLKTTDFTEQSHAKLATLKHCDSYRQESQESLKSFGRHRLLKYAAMSNFQVLRHVQ